MCEKGKQSGSAPCATALHRAGRDVKDAGGLGDGVGLHVHEDEGGPLLGGQGGQGGEQFAVQVLSFGGRLSGFVRFQKLIESFGVIHRRGSARGGLTGSVQTRVDGDPVQPRGDGGLTAEGVCGAEGGNESVLHGVRGLFAITERPQGHGPEAVTMAANELTEGVRFACDMLIQEILVAGVGESGVVQR